MKKNNNIETSTWQIEGFDTAIAFLAGLAIIPAIFACSTNIGDNGLPVELSKAGPSLIFIILPQLFNTMIGGRIIAIIFFFLVLFAAITSSVSLYETVVSSFSDKYNINRNKSVVITLIICLIIGALSSLGYGPLGSFTILGMQFLDFFDFISNSVLMPICAILTCIFVGYIIKPKTIIEEVKISSKFHWQNLFTIVIKYIAPILIAIILIASILQAAGKLSI